MTIDPQSFLAVALPAVAVIIWLVRLEGRVNTGEQRVTDLKADVKYIRDRIDAALNGRTVK